MSQIKYNWENIRYENTNNFKGLVLDGWAVGENKNWVDFKVDTEGCSYVWYRVQRPDVAAVYNCVSKCGIHAEILCSAKDKIIEFILRGEEEEINCHLDVPSEKNIKKSTIVDSYKYRITDDFCYTIDNFMYDNVSDKIVLVGWAFSKDSDEVISLTDDANGKVQKISRPDVKEYYKDKNVNTMCGFEVQVFCAKAGKSLNFVVGKNECYASFNMKELCKEISNKEIKKVNVKKIVLNLFRKYKNIWRYGKNGADYKDNEYAMFLNESMMNKSNYVYEEVKIPEKWIELQKNKPLVELLIPVKKLEENLAEINEVFDCIKKQSYKNIIVTVCGSKEDIKFIAHVDCNKVICNSNDKSNLIWEGMKNSQAEFCLVVEQEDTFSEQFIFSFIEEVNIHFGKKVYYADYDVCHRGEEIAVVRRAEKFKDETFGKFFLGALLDVKFVQESRSLEELTNTIKDLKEEDTYNINKVCYHVNITENKWEEEKSKIIAFYLPQFHENPENNEWWGKGFTEWTNVKRGYAMFEGHNQPRVPERLGYYDLVEDKLLQKKQVELAKDNDIFGFCFYYYWFKGKRLLEKPVTQYVENKDLTLPYCICWANETWSRRWDGAEREILMKQVHNSKTDREFISDVMPMFSDFRYIRVNGKPLLLIYRIELFPRPAKTIAVWRKICRRAGIGEIHVALVQSFGMVDHRIYGADSSVEFPPHKIVAGTINEKVLSEEMNEEYTGKIYSYKEVVENQMLIRRRDYQLWPGCMLGWDNTARRLKAANVFHEFSPELYERWLIKNHVYTKLYNEQPYMFVNAWNEWAEGTYLEPDAKYGDSLLKISSEVVKNK